MSSSIHVDVALSHPFVPTQTYLEEPLYAVLTLEPTAGPTAGRAPLNLVLVVDASATMHHFQLTEEEREYWMGMAISRDEMERGEADESDAVYWTGQTLAEMQNVARTPMSVAAEAVRSLLGTLSATDNVALIAFADSVHPVFSAGDWQLFPEQCLIQLDLLREQRLPVDIGTGTYMAEAVRVAGEVLASHVMPGGVNRMIILSDGIVQDGPQTLEAIGQVRDAGYAITTVGVGDEFDEEFLTQAADSSRGEYHYAPDVAQIVDVLSQEMNTLQTIGVTDVYLAVRGLEGAVVQDVALVRPSMALFDELYTEEGWVRARVGDVSGSAPSSVLVQIAPPTLPGGAADVAEVLLTWTGAGSAAGGGTQKATVSVTATDDPSLLASQSETVADLVHRFSIYKFEREAQRAQERGDLDKAREKLGAATRELHAIGENALAADVEAQMTALGQAGSDPSRAKRIKATTRKLAAPADYGNPPPAPPATGGV